MKTLIVYSSIHGCTEQCAELLKTGITGETEIINLKNKAAVPIEPFDTVLIGGSIHAGMIQGTVKKFCKKNLQTLLSKNIGLFLCCGFDGEKATEQFNNAFPSELQEHAGAQGFFLFSRIIQGFGVVLFGIQIPGIDRVCLFKIGY